jgi:D-lyxose ketol-isomerase
MALTKDEWRGFQRLVVEELDRAGIVLTPAEQEEVEIADFGLNCFEKEGLGVVVYVNTPRSCAKELVMLPGQTCPQHRHPPVGDDPGKEETFRVRRGVCYLQVDTGSPAQKPRAVPPGESYQPLHEVVLHEGEQFTIPPDTWHWFQAGPEGAIISEFSTTSRDELDIFLDPNIKRLPEVTE